MRGIGTAAWVVPAGLVAASPELVLLTPELQALLGGEPEVTMAEQGMPLPPTEAMVAELPPLQRAREAAALKEALLILYACSREDGNRLSPDCFAAAAGAARSASAAPALTDLLQRAAEQRLSGGQLHALQLALAQWCSAYGADPLALRLLVEALRLTPEELRAAVEWLPLADMAQSLPPQEVDPRALEADLRLMAASYGTMAQRLAAVDSREQADAAAQELLPALQQLLTTGRTRRWLARGDASAVPGELLCSVEQAYAAFGAQRVRLQSVGCFDSLLLRILLELVS
ncbi:MAG: hypothetical protein ACI4OS_06800 [Akkermansia sp.]